MNTIAIIGGGASGTITAINLLQKLTVPAQVYVIEKNPELMYRGNAYGSKFSYEPLNVPAGKMSMYNADHDNFYNWLLTHKPQESAAINLTKGSFVSRRWFGDYLEGNLLQAVENKNSDVKYNELVDSVTDVDSTETIHTITLASGRKIEANLLIFATGNEAPKPLIDEVSIAQIGNRYANYPWKGIEEYKINKEDDVLLVGTGLTMIDNAVSLNQSGHTGKIYLLSWHAHFPLQHADSVHLDALEIKGTTVHQIFNELKAVAKEKVAAGISWQSVMDSLRPLTTPLWQQLSLGEKKFFFKHLRPYWEIHRHRMPQLSASHLHNMINTGKAVLLKGSIKSVSDNKGSIAVNYGGRQQQNTIHVKYIVNCTGPNSDYANLPGTLYHTLAQKGMVSFDDLKLGIVTTTNGSPVNAKGEAAKNIFSVGPVRKASEWETTAVREIRTQGEQLATLINHNLENDYAAVTTVMAL